MYPGVILSRAFLWCIGISEYPPPLFFPASVVLYACAGALLGAALHRRRGRAIRVPDAPLCGKCGYNLTGNVSGVCPECGTPVE
jgi:hypothetical protein